MSRFEYFLAFETILYGLILAHLVVGFSKMVYHRKTINFYWAHTLACITNFFVIIQTYYSLYWVPDETITGPWSFFFLRIMPLTLQYIIVYQIIPEKVEGLQAETFIYSRLKEILIPMVVFNLMAAVKTIYYRWDEYLDIGGDVIYGSLKFWTFVLPFVFVSSVALFLIFRYPKKRWIEAFLIFTTFIVFVMMFATPEHQ